MTDYECEWCLDKKEVIMPNGESVDCWYCNQKKCRENGK